MELLTGRIEEIINPFLNETGLELIDLEVHRQGRDFVIQVLVDRPNGGITIHECSQLNKRIILAIDDKNLLVEGYNLEVSSPGLDRPLRTLKDFSRIVGREVRVLLSEPVQGRVEYAGIMRCTEGENVIIQSVSAEIVIPVSKIQKGLLII